MEGSTRGKLKEKHKAGEEVQRGRGLSLTPWGLLGALFSHLETRNQAMVSSVSHWLKVVHSVGAHAPQWGEHLRARRASSSFQPSTAVNTRSSWGMLSQC